MREEQTRSCVLPDMSSSALYFHPKFLFTMRRFLLLSALLVFFGGLLMPAPTWAQSPNLDWRLDHVTCHEVGALLTFETPMRSSGGEWVASLSGVPRDADVSSVQVELPEGIRLVAVNQAQVMPDVAEEVTWMAKQVEAKQLALDLEHALLEALDQERMFLESNRAIGGGGDVLLVDDVEEMRHYLAQRHKELSLDRVDLMSNIRALESDLSQSQHKLESLRRRAGQPENALQLVVSGQGRGTARVQVATQLAGWVSSYDVSWSDKAGELDMARYARVVQTTGQDWSDVTLDLRTGQPLGWNVAPEARPQLQSSQPASYDGYCANVKWVNSGLNDSGARQDVLRGQGALASNWKMTASQRVSVNGEGDAARVWLDDLTAEATPRWTARPGRSETAFRSCHTKAWMDWRALSGESRVFQGNAMMGVMPLNMPTWGDSLVVQLGYDDGVRATTELVQDESGTKKLSGKRVVEQVRRLHVDNEGDSVATVDVLEQLPLGPNWDMTVEATNGGEWDPSTGEVVWSAVQVPGSGSWEATVIVRIVVPKRGSVVGL